MPEFDSVDALVKFFETHDLGDYLEQMPAVDFDVDIQKRTHLFVIDEELANKVTEIAQAKRVPSETLIEVWLREKVLEQAPATP